MTSRKIAEEEKEIAQTAEDYANALEAQLRKESSSPGNLTPGGGLDFAEPERNTSGTNTTLRSLGIIPYSVGFICIFAMLLQVLILHYDDEDEGKEKLR